MPGTELTPIHHDRRWLIWTAGTVLLAGALTAFCLLRNREIVAAAPVPQTVDGGALKTTAGAAEIFQRAFWTRPRPEDKIRHAERREWISESDGVRKWEWFVDIEPGPGLVDDLRQRFALVPAELKPEKFAASPDWFRTSLASTDTVLASADGSMQLIVSADRHFLLATGAGGGFAKAIAGP